MNAKHFKNSAHAAAGSSSMGSKPKSGMTSGAQNHKDADGRCRDAHGRFAKCDQSQK